MVLAEWVFPEFRMSCQELYFRGRAEKCDTGLFIPSGTSLSFDTYFNGMFYGEFDKNTVVRTIIVSTITSGSLELSLYSMGQDRLKNRLATLKSEGNNKQNSFPEVRIADLPPSGILYVNVTAISDAVVHRGFYETNVHSVSDLKIAVVICTYHREDYVYDTLGRMHEGLLGKEEFLNAIQCLVIDNGNTMDLHYDPNIRVIPNKNCGGSGGFARGLLEAVSSDANFTHVLLMDDDIRFECEIIARTIRFLRLTKTTRKQLCVGGHMLLENNPGILYEAGGTFQSGRIWGYGGGTDLTDTASLLRTCVLPTAQYNAWWYCCMPISEVRRNGLPMPFFIKCDDIEYALRMDMQVVTMNGIGVWHKDFAEKNSPHLEYYIKRNELVVSILYETATSIRNAIGKLVRAYGKAIATGNTGTVPYILKAYRDFIYGPAFFEETDEEILNNTLMQQAGQRGEGRLRSLLLEYPQVLAIIVKLVIKCRKLKDTYKSGMMRYRTPDFWNRRLEIQEDCLQK